jgi:hypothetical protein
MKARIRIAALPPASLLAKRGQDGGEGFSNSAEVKAANPHPTLSQTHSCVLTGASASVSPNGREKGEANQTPTPSKEPLDPQESR